MSNLIRIDTSNTHDVSVELEHNGKLDTETASSTIAKSQVVLPLIHSLLNRNKVRITDIEKIYVKTGPGSYTGLRVGIAIANMLGYLLSLPVNDLPIGCEVRPRYEQYD